MSSARQEVSGLSLDQQKRQMIEYAEKHGLDLGPLIEIKLPDGRTVHQPARLCQEPESAYKVDFTEREVGGWVDMQLREGDHILIAKVDRAFRSIIDTLQTIGMWHERGVHVHALDIGIPLDSDMGKWLLMMLAMFAEMESTRKSERMIDAMRSARSIGRPIIQCPPFGFKWSCENRQDRRLVPYPEELAQVRLIWEMFVDQEMGCRPIANWLNANRIRRLDKRSKGSKRRFESLWHHHCVELALIVANELSLFEEEGMTPDEAAEEWLRCYREQCLPNPDEIEVRREAAARKKGVSNDRV